MGEFLKTYTRDAFEATPIGAVLSSCREIYDAHHYQDGPIPDFDMFYDMPALQHVVLPINRGGLASYYTVSGGGFRFEGRPAVRLALEIGNGEYEELGHRGVIKRFGTNHDRIDIEAHIDWGDAEHVHITSINRCCPSNDRPDASGVDQILNEIGLIIEGLNDGYTVNLQQLKRDVLENFGPGFNGPSADFTRAALSSPLMPLLGRGRMIIREKPEHGQEYGLDRPYRVVAKRSSPAAQL